ncbi:MAG: metallophosphoesterase family protein [Woeseiaceae bacterium]|nr:metallophosphoesterase family protein [Woeseiaceae bacterium]
MHRKFRLRFARVFALCLVLAACSDSDNDLCAVDGSPVDPSRLFLQQLTATSVIVKWRGEGEGVCFSEDVGQLADFTAAVATEADHKEALLQGLKADTLYYYGVGDRRRGSDEQAFRTAPVTGELPASGQVRILVVGDSGTATPSVEQHLPAAFNGSLRSYEGFQRYNNYEALDLFLMLGDNAYEDGTDEEYQAAVFDLYSGLVNKTPLWPTIGNHEMGVGDIVVDGEIVLTASSFNQATSIDGFRANADDPGSRMPYIDIFTLPTKGEAGGVPSGTEQYYSLDYGNTHIVSLDSQISARDADARAAMLDWVTADLSANTQDWTVVIFHHPPYSKGSHGSDTTDPAIASLKYDQPMVDMRVEFTPVFEDHGVDLVYSGHSHSYERSAYIHSHTGDSDTFDPAVHAELNDSGEMASGQDDESYGQVSRSGSDDKVVYTVAGNNGKLSSAALDHPAHLVGFVELGSVLIEAGASEMTATFINDAGAVLDHVTITR